LNLTPEPLPTVNTGEKVPRDWASYPITLPGSLHSGHLPRKALTCKTGAHIKYLPTNPGEGAGKGKTDSYSSEPCHENREEDGIVVGIAGFASQKLKQRKGKP